MTRKLNSHIIANVFLNSNFHFHAGLLSCKMNISLYFFCTTVLKSGAVEATQVWASNCNYQNWYWPFHEFFYKWSSKNSSCLSQHKTQEENQPRFQTPLFPMVPLDYYKVKILIKRKLQNLAPLWKHMY